MPTTTTSTGDRGSTFCTLVLLCTHYRDRCLTAVTTLPTLAENSGPSGWPMVIKLIVVQFLSVHALLKHNYICRLLQRVYGPIPPLTGIPIHLLLNRSQTVKKFVHTTKLPQLPVSQLWVIITAAAPTSSTTTTTSTPNPTNSTSSLHVHEHSRIVGRQEDPRSSKLVLHQQVPPSWRSFVPSSSTY